MVLLNKRNYIKSAKILGIVGAFLLFGGSFVYAETVVHTEKSDTVRAKARANLNATANKKEITPRKPVPYTWDQAVEYAKMHKEDITPHKYGGYKDKFGNFSRLRTLDFLGDEGLANRGNSILGFPDFTYLRLWINYGQGTEKTQPFAVISWNFNRLSGFNEENPQVCNIVFESGYVKQLSTSSQWYSAGYIHSGILVYSWASDRGGSVVLSNEDIWDIYKHGDIANVYVNYGGSRNINFFYSGNKQEEHKKQLTYGFEHLTRLLNINPSTLEYERRQRKIYEINQYRGKIRSKLKNEIKAKILEEEFKKEVQEEVREEIRSENELLGK